MSARHKKTCVKMSNRIEHDPFGKLQIMHTCATMLNGTNDVKVVFWRGWIYEKKGGRREKGRDKREGIDEKKWLSAAEDGYGHQFILL
jgi:hypothetical protein